MDKAPLSLWLQAASAKTFGFHGLSLLLPQAVAGILAVYVLYRTVRWSHGPAGGLVAALVLAVTPISVVTSRTNLPDPLLILLLLLAASATLRSVEQGSLGWLLGSAAHRTHIGTAAHRTCIVRALRARRARLSGKSLSGAADIAGRRCKLILSHVTAAVRANPGDLRIHRRIGLRERAVALRTDVWGRQLRPFRRSGEKDNGQGSAGDEGQDRQSQDRTMEGLAGCHSCCTAE